ncbi:MAG: FAD-dependent oxidoreductase, partial [Pirellulaceae bacterium]
GGKASIEVRMHIVGADCSGRRGTPLQVEAREGGLVEEIRLEAAVHNPQRSPSVFDLILYDKCRSQENLRLMLNTTVCGADVERDIVRSIRAIRPTTEEAWTITARVFLDCTGDGRLGAESGARFRSGREARGEFGESLAVDEADDYRLGSTVMFQARKYDRPMPFTPPSWARRFSEQELRLRPHATPTLDLGLEYGYWWAEWGGTRDTIRDNELIRDELLAILLGIWDHIKNRGDHGADNWALTWCGFVPGKRESRRFLGRYVLRQQDVMESRRFPDAIAYGGWHIDLHPPHGVDAIDEPPCTQHAVPFLYDIPLRACVSADRSNLMFAGRNISATHVAFASTRVMATCAAVGQGVGTAAALCVRDALTPAELCEDRPRLEELQQQLLRDDVYLVGRLGQWPGDHARDAIRTASSWQVGGEPDNVISGQTRSVHGEHGAPPDRSFPGTHRWQSDPSQTLPQWLQLAWSDTRHIRRVQLIFDTGLHRPLTFSLADAYTALMLWGQAQPETVRDYRVYVRSSGQWKIVAEVWGNYQRRRVHACDEPQADALRIEILATNGLDHARVCEVRVE